jgi:hypothetical protein
MENQILSIGNYYHEKWINDKMLRVFYNIYICHGCKEIAFENNVYWDTFTMYGPQQNISLT